MATTSDLLLLDDLLSDGEREVRDRVRRFCVEEVRPVINAHWEAATFPFELLPGLARLGVCGGSFTGHGLPGLSPLAAGPVSMELARGDGSVSTFHGVHSGLAMTAIAMLGSPGQKERWLPAMARLELVGACALTEPDHGSDAVTLETRVPPRRRLRDRRREAVDRQRRVRRPGDRVGARRAGHLGDAEVVSTVEGTDVVHALIVGREITGLSAFS